MFKSVWCAYNINETICQWPFSFYGWERAWLPRHTPGTTDSRSRSQIGASGERHRGQALWNVPYGVGWRVPAASQQRTRVRNPRACAAPACTR